MMTSMMIMKFKGMMVIMVFMMIFIDDDDFYRRKGRMVGGR